MSRDDSSALGGRASRDSPAERAPAGDSSGDRWQIIEAFVATVGERGYLNTKVSELTARAGVTRTHFYELFKDKEDCFLAAQRELAAPVVDHALQAIAAADPSGAAQAAIAAVSDLAQREPARFAFLTHEATLAGPSAWQERTRIIDAIAGGIERRWDQLPAEAPLPDLDTGYLLGGAIRALSMRMRRGEARPTGLWGELVGWIDSYQVPKDRRRWSSISASARRPHERETSRVGPGEPAPLPRGRHRVAPADARRSQRERLVRAAGRVTAERGYAKATVADIVAAAGVSREVFYEHFADKQEAFAETIRFVFEALMARSAGAFFGSDSSWPERIWGASDAFVGFIAAQPDLCHAVFVEPHAVAADVQRPDDFVVGFTLFLEDGYRYRPAAAAVPRIAGEAIGGVVLEAINSYLRSGRAAELAGVLPGLAYTVLAPFMGTDAAYEFVMGKAREVNGDQPLTSP